jgi:hypothetical protein
VNCITKGQAGQKYEFGQKVSGAVSSKEGWMLGALARAGNPYNEHTLQQQIDQVERLCIKKSGEKMVHVDMGYRGHNYAGDHVVIVDKRRRARNPETDLARDETSRRSRTHDGTPQNGSPPRPKSAPRHPWGLHQCNPKRSSDELRQAHGLFLAYFVLIPGVAFTEIT